MLIKSCEIALAQIDCRIGDLGANLRHHLEFIDRAIQLGASAIVFPELSLTGYTVRDVNSESALKLTSAPQLGPLIERSHQITIFCGAIEADDRAGIYNVGLCIEDGKILHVHRKIYPPTYGLFEERRYFLSGTEVRAFDSRRLGRVGMLICEDLWHPILPYSLAHQDAQLIIGLAASPTRLDFGLEASSSNELRNYEINREHHATYARLFGIYFAFANRVGVEDGVNFWGGSELVQPDGKTVVRLADFEEDMKIARIEPALVRNYRQSARHFLDDDPQRNLNFTMHLSERK